MLWLLVIATLVAQSASFCELNGNSLNCDGESLENVVSQHIAVKDGLNSISIRNCNTRKLEDNGIPFKQADKLKISCNIQEIKPQSLQGLERLRQLDLSGNKISNIPRNFFQNHQRLETLDLSSNHLRNPSVKFLEHLNNLKVLNLSSNRITAIGTNVFNSAPNLEELYLSNNNIVVMIEGMFDDLPNLRIVDMSRINMEGIMLKLFEENLKLEKLKISWNNLKDFNATVFKNNAEMLDLDMGYCKLEDIGADAFVAMTKLKTLCLAGNPSPLPTGVFDKLVNLEELDLSNMNLRSIGDDLLSKNLKLSKLDVSLNHLTQLSEAVMNLQLLTTIDFSSNKIAEIPSKMYQLDNLKFLNASANRIAEIKKGNVKWTKLEVFDIRRNLLEYLDPELFAQSALTHFDVRDNRLAFVETGIFGSLPKLQRFEFTGNPWDCECMNDLLLVLRKNRVQYFKNGYFSGEKRVCVVGDDDSCRFNKTSIKAYYEIFIGDK